MLARRHESFAQIHFVNITEEKAGSPVWIIHHAVRVDVAGNLSATRHWYPYEITLFLIASLEDKEMVWHKPGTIQLLV